MYVYKDVLDHNSRQSMYFLWEAHFEHKKITVCLLVMGTSFIVYNNVESMKNKIIPCIVSGNHIHY